MALPKPVSGHHTVWIQENDRKAVSARYAVSGENLVCFGDDGLSAIRDGARVTASVHEIASGPPLASFGALVRVVPGADVPQEALLDLLAHVRLGRDLDEVMASVERHRERRLIELVP